MKALLQKMRVWSGAEVKVELADLNELGENQTVDFAHFRNADLGASIGRIMNFKVQFIKVFALSHAALLALHIVLVFWVPGSFWSGIILFIIGGLLSGLLGSVVAIVLFFWRLRKDFRNLFELTLGGFRDVVATRSNAVFEGADTEKVVTELFVGYVSNVIKPAVSQAIRQEVPIVHRIIVPITSTILLRVSDGLSIVMAKAIKTGDAKLGQVTSIEQRLVVVQRAIGHCKTKVDNVSEKVFSAVLRLLIFLTFILFALYVILLIFVS